MTTELPHGLKIRKCISDDHSNIIDTLKVWWGSRDLTRMLPKLFLNHFHNSSFVIEKEEKLVGLLVGFLSQSNQNEGYSHFAGVHPEYRGQSLGQILYKAFF